MSFFKPQTLNDIAGNKAALESVEAILSRKDLAPRSYLVDGPSGVGKSEVARLILESFGGPEATHLVDNVESLASLEVEQLARLIDSDTKYVVMIATDIYKVHATLKNRAYRVPLAGLSSEALTGLLAKVCAANKLDYSLGGLALVAKNAHGNPRRGLVTLQAVASRGAVTEEAVSMELPDLEDSCLAILQNITKPQAMTDIIKLGENHPTDEIVDKLFTAFSVAVFTGSLPPQLQRTKRTISIFLRWKSGVNLPSESLPLLLRELADADKPDTEAQMARPVEVLPPPWELGVKELARALNAEILEGM